MKNKFIKKVCVFICIGFMAFASFSSIYAAGALGGIGAGITGQTGQNSQNGQTGAIGGIGAEQTGQYEPQSILDAIFGQGGNFFRPSEAPTGNDEIGNAINNRLKGLGIIDAIMNVGNLIFIIITSVLGVRYIFANSSDKADIKNSLVTLCVAIIFFFLAQTVYDFSSGTMIEALSGGSYSSLEGKIWATASTVISICAILGIVLVGLRYMLAPADTKADIKTQLIPVVIGIILVYCSISVINFIISVSSAALTTS